MDWGYWTVGDYVAGDPDSDDWEMWGAEQFYAEFEDAQLELVTNGEPGSSDDALYVLEVSVWALTAYNDPTETPIPYDQIQVLGQTVGPDGKLVVKRPQNQTFAATPQVPAQYENKRYALNVAPARFQIMLDGVDVTGQTNTVVVGQRIGLSCGFNGSASSGLTDIAWTIPGVKVSGFNPTVNSDGLAPFDTNQLSTNVCIFHWVDGGAKEIFCSAFINGNLVAAKTTVNVVRPIASFTGTKIGTVAANDQYSFPGYWLHFGKRDPTNAVGIKFEADIQSAPNGQFFFLQTLDGTFEKTRVDGNQWHMVFANALDNLTNTNSYEYRFRQDYLPSLATDDSPGVDLLTDDSTVTAGIAFRMYLMFQSEISNAIAVPISRVNWSWSGTASRNNTPPPPWVLMGAGEPPNSITGSATTSHPTWSTNAAAAVWVPKP